MPSSRLLVKCGRVTESQCFTITGPRTKMAFRSRVVVKECETNARPIQAPSRDQLDSRVDTAY